MSTEFIGGASGAERPVLEAQQALLVAALRRAGGRPMSYAELREAGIELPASVVSELELAGIPIERCFGGAHGGRHVVGVRLAEPVLEPEPAAPPALESEPAAPPTADVGETSAAAPAGAGAESGWNAVRVYRASRALGLADAVATTLRSAVAAVGAGRTPGMRLLAPIALGVAVLVVALLVVIGLGGGNAHPRLAGARHPAHKQRLATATAPQTRTAATTTATPAPATTATPPTPVSPALATQLEAQGHTLLVNGQYGNAVRVLRRALAATGEQAKACVEPSSAICLTYAYALYDLGRALRLSGNSAAAVPILEARLQIDNQRPVVASELQLARQQAG